MASEVYFIEILSSESSPSQVQTSAVHEMHANMTKSRCHLNSEPSEHRLMITDVLQAVGIITSTYAPLLKHISDKYPNANEHLSHSSDILSSSTRPLGPINVQIDIKAHARNAHLWVGCGSFPVIYQWYTVRFLSHAWNLLPTDLGYLFSHGGGWCPPGRSETFSPLSVFIYQWERRARFISRGGLNLLAFPTDPLDFMTSISCSADAGTAAKSHLILSNWYKPVSW